jgi:hypothetical protein
MLLIKAFQGLTARTIGLELEKFIEVEAERAFVGFSMFFMDLLWLEKVFEGLANISEVCRRLLRISKLAKDFKVC